MNPRVTFVSDAIEQKSEESTVLSYKILLKNTEESDAGTWSCRSTLPEAGLVLEDSTKVEVSSTISMDLYTFLR